MNLKLVWEVVGLNRNKLATIRTTVWEDNQFCTILVNFEPPRMTPSSNHYALKYHWFCTQLKPNGIVIKGLLTTDQLGDMLTRCLRCAPFKQCRFKVMGG